MIKHKKKILFIGVPLLVLLVVGVSLWALTYFGVIKSTSSPFAPKEPQVSIKKEYKNPFDKKTQYVNPFETYKNPFVIAK